MKVLVKLSPGLNVGSRPIRVSLGPQVSANGIFAELLGACGSACARVAITKARLHVLKSRDVAASNDQFTLVSDR